MTHCLLEHLCGSVGNVVGELFLDDFEWGVFVSNENSAFRVIGRPELDGTAGVFAHTGSVTGAVPRAGLAADDYVDLGLVSGTSNTFAAFGIEYEVQGKSAVRG
jgi:hypothetical protein